MYKNKIFKALILASGSGQRMQSKVQKQYLEIHQKPMLIYSLEVFEQSPIDEIILVVKAGEEAYCQDLVQQYALKKVKKIVSGGSERYNSTANGLAAAAPCDYVLIHDSARPCVTGDIIIRCMDTVIETGACSAGVPATDTINLVDDDQKVVQTLNRNSLWSVQTPQTFCYDTINNAHKRLQERLPLLSSAERLAITDDVKIAQVFAHVNVHMVLGAYENIKVTTPFDLKIAATFLDDHL